MNERYMRELRRHLHCSRKTKKHLLEHFAAYRRNIADENLEYDRMVVMFGPPEEMSRILMEEVADGECVGYHRNKLVQKIAAVVLAVGFVAFSLYVMFIKEINVIEYREWTSVGESFGTLTETEGTS